MSFMPSPLIHSGIKYKNDARHLERSGRPAKLQIFTQHFVGVVITGRFINIIANKYQFNIIYIIRTNIHLGGIWLSFKGNHHMNMTVDYDDDDYSELTVYTLSIIGDHE
ncbi:hypothetical protein HYN51_01465 [Limnobaculum parvum]|uniref:Uncharacterized protein n=1 Tax=Limnobaculum parvum TaxID=2172103 RepID=A0A2Y9TV63_9GAMM|nr:hypothetical protein HYN51_01465 [Limnobaculum parvum]